MTPAYRARAGVVARAKGMAPIAGQTGLSREQLYRSFSENGNPTLKTTLAVMRPLGVELTAKVSAAAQRDQRGAAWSGTFTAHPPPG